MQEFYEDNYYDSMRHQVWNSCVAPCLLLTCSWSLHRSCFLQLETSKDPRSFRIYFSAAMNQVNVDSSTGRNGRLGAVSLASFHLHRTMSWAFQAWCRGRWFHVWKWLYSNGLHELPCTQEILGITSMELEELSFGLFLLAWAGCRVQSLYS